MRSYSGGFFVVFFTLLLVIAAIVGSSWYVLTRPVEFAENINVPLPLHIGGRLPLEVDGEAILSMSDLSVVTSMNLRLTPAAINLSLPVKDFSILVHETDNPSITSMLGRLQFMPGSATVTIIGREVMLSAQVVGEFHVRASRQYQKDEEQPGGGDVIPMRAEVVFHAINLGLNPQWGLGQVTMSVQVRLDETTRSAWHGKFGTGPNFADLVERILNERSTHYLGRLDLTSTDLRLPLHELIKHVMQKSKVNANLRFIKISRVEVDSCPTQDNDGTVVFGIFLQAMIDLESTVPPTLPDLVVRPEPC